MSHAATLRAMLVLCAAALPAACGESDDQTPSAPRAAKPVTAAQAACDPSANPGIDCACVGAVVSNGLSSADYAQHFSSSTVELAQHEIDTLMDVALVVDDVCR
ncbi:MAG: hypothetical protein AAF337_15115 [Pseudomonadota bacterium]